MTENHSSSTHPPLPPTTEDDRVQNLRLLRSRRVGPATYRRLIAEHGSARAALAALPEIARAAGVSDYTPCPEGVVQAELKAADRAKARLIFDTDTDFPALLRDTDDAPVALWATGDRAILTKPMVSIVGARNASSLGTRMARKLAEDLSLAGFAVVSGLARGVDAAAHNGALDQGTLAVMAGGVDVLYPAENAELAAKIAKTGLRLSDQPMGLQPRARHFVARNRIISGLSRATIVIEAAAKSGTLITARGALDQGRDVLAVPGHPFDARVAGCNMLLRDGALLIRGAQDVIDHLGDPKAVAPELPFDAPPSTDKRTLRETAVLHSDILDRLGHNPIAEDQLIRRLGASATAVAPILMDLELDGQVIRQPGGLLARAV